MQTKVLLFRDVVYVLTVTLSKSLTILLLSSPLAYISFTVSALLLLLFLFCLGLFFGCCCFFLRLISFFLFFSHFVSPLLFSDDGSVRVWRNLEGETYSDKSLEMVTAWQALSGMLPSTRGMLVCHSSKHIRLALTDCNKK